MPTPRQFYVVPDKRWPYMLPSERARFMEMGEWQSCDDVYLLLRRQCWMRSFEM